MTWLHQWHPLHPASKMSYAFLLHIIFILKCFEIPLYMCTALNIPFYKPRTLMLTPHWRILPQADRPDISAASNVEVLSSLHSQSSYEIHFIYDLKEFSRRTQHV